MGRPVWAAQGLDFLLHDLHRFAFEAGLSTTDHGSMHRSARGVHEGNSNSLPGSETDRGQVLGEYTGADLVSAKDIEPSRLSFPQDRPLFDPAEFLDKQHSECYRDPFANMFPEELIDRGPPRVQIKASRRQTKSLLRFLDDHHRLCLAPAEKVKARYACGAFALIKDSQKDRLIVDARPFNDIEHTMTEWTSTLGSVTALVQLELEADCNLYFSGTDLRDFYYCFAVSDERSLRNTLKIKLRPHEVQDLGCFTSDLWSASFVYPSLRTLAMGDCNAVELGQMSHVNLGISARAFCPHELLVTHGRAPRGRISAGVVIDDVLIAEQLHPTEAEGVIESEYRLNLLCEEYQRVGLTAHPAKTFRKATSTDVWGVTLDGIRGTCRGSAKRLIPLIEVTARTARLRVATVGFLEILAGAWVSLLQIRRRMLSLLQHIYAVQVGRSRASIIALPAVLIAELWTLVILGPLAVADLRAQTLSSGLSE